MKKCNVALIGCGTVGMGVAQALLEGGPLAERLGACVRLKHIVDLRADDIRASLELPEGVLLGADMDAALSDPEVDVVVELIGGTSAAADLIERALRAGKDVVTANKALLAERGDSLYRLARENGRCIAFEASVAGGVPVIAALRSSLVGDRIESIYGIVNGTCNFVLTRMLDRDVPYAEALAEAQELGYAEADPRFDVEGVDSAHKLVVLARLAFGVDVKLADIPREGISGVALYDVEAAHELGYALKLLAIGVRRDERLELRVHPVLLSRQHPLAGVSGVYNALCIHGSRVGEIVLTGQGAGRMPTASAVVADIARVALGTYGAEFDALNQFDPVPAADLVPAGEATMRYYFRLDCRDQPGVLAQVAGILSEHEISIASVHQKDVARTDGDFVPVVFMTHLAREDAMCAALDQINQLAIIRGESTCMLRVADI